ncbi:MAG: helix-turn-helix domain-containing protein [Anaerolineales bacterium]|nr:helix-turn-helix domain-containing protein [Anaerolineales bacterium]
MENHFPEPLLKASQVAKILNISRAFAYQLMQKGVLPTVRILGARRVRPEDLDRYIRESVSQSGQKGIK